MTSIEERALAVATGAAPTTVEGLTLSISEIKRHVGTVQQVMRDVMILGTHYGEPFPSKRTGGDRDEEAKRKYALLKPGAELLCMTFRIAPTYEVEELPEVDGAVRYRIRCRGVHQTTGVVLAEGLGEASTREEKFGWRRAVCEEEFMSADVESRRIRYRGNDKNWWKEMQIAEAPADKANTVLKMAAKRALVAMILNATAASDMFMQDIEDFADFIDVEATEPSEPTRKKPRAKTEKAPGADAPPPAPAPAPTPPKPTREEVEAAREKAKATIADRLAALEIPLEQAKAESGVAEWAKLSKEDFAKLAAYCERRETARAAAAAAPPPPATTTTEPA